MVIINTSSTYCPIVVRQLRLPVYQSRRKIPSFNERLLGNAKRIEYYVTAVLILPTRTLQHTSVRTIE